ncbi:MAG TPA: G1 family glutamic endopeptidase, partial [Pseudonocardiaceae bacterium]|nr:G1 family glutamic endopeptidase [Pseudonocardiaceae bacterium]
MHLRSHRVLGTALVACVPALGMLLAFGPAAGASTAAASPSARAAAAARIAIEHLQVGQHGAVHRMAGQASRVKGLTQVESTNWSGYADTGSSFSTVTSSWTEPTGTCSGRTESLAAFWVGIDGYSSDSVEQDGTLIECYRGTAYNYTWWEMYPTNDIQVVGESLKPGDQISASVVRSGTSYTLAVTDSTHTANSFSTKQTCSSCANSSAEWIAEAPSGSSGVYPLTDFGSVSFSKATVTEGSTSGVISSFTDDEITMITSSGATEATPSALNSSGN